MLGLEKKISSFLKESNMKHILLSISSGVDSVVLLDVLMKIQRGNNNLKISLCHIDYNMHKKSKDALGLCKSYANNYNLTLFYKSVSIKYNNFESNARSVRYKFLNEVSADNKIDLIITAHNYNDQIETLIMKDEDSSDWVSFLGVRYFSNNIYRPMLNVKKEDIYLYAKNQHLSWVEDPTNTELRFKRNRIRMNLKHNFYSKYYIENLLGRHSNSKLKALRFKNDFDMIYKPLVIDFQGNIIRLNKNIVNYIQEYTILKLVIMKYLKVYFNLSELHCSRSHWTGLFNYLNNSKHGKVFNLSKKVIFLKDRDEFCLYLDRNINNKFKIQVKNEISTWYETAFVLKNKVENSSFPYIKISKKKLTDGIFLTHWKDGDIVKNNNMTKKVSDLFVNNKVSMLCKDTYPIVRDIKDKIIWIPDIACDLEENINDFLYLSWRN